MSVSVIKSSSDQGLASGLCLHSQVCEGGPAAWRGLGRKWESSRRPPLGWWRRPPCQSSPRKSAGRRSASLSPPEDHRNGWRRPDSHQTSPPSWCTWTLGPSVCCPPPWASRPPCGWPRPGWRWGGESWPHGKRGRGLAGSRGYSGVTSNKNRTWVRPHSSTHMFNFSVFVCVDIQNEGRHSQPKTYIA